mmetsp:Transcript_70438/g.182696  ORF Transcript_70438/g.182696 Transcript_70438/m.182696 type:complete len:315 (+) Transcript_70438:104-1048(+)
MVTPTPYNAIVPDKYKPVKWGLIGTFNGVMVLYVAWSVYAIFSALDTPPLVHSLVDEGTMEGGLPKFGRMPYLVFSPQTEGADVWLEKFALRDFAAHRDTFVRVRPDMSRITQKALPGGSLIVNLTNLIPDFSIVDEMDGIPAEVRPQLQLNIRSSAKWLNIFTIDPTTPPEELIPPWGNDAGHIFRFQGVVEHAHSVFVSMNKRVVPRSEIFWGWEKPPVREKSIINFEQTWPRDIKEAFNFHLTVQSKFIDRSEAVSFFAQVAKVLGQIGGFMAGFNAFFFFLFVKRRPHTPAEQDAMEITLLGTEEKHTTM